MYTYRKLILMCLDDIKPGRQTEIQRWVFGVDGLATPQKYMLGVRREQSSRQRETGGREIGREPEVESCWGCPYFQCFLPVAGQQRFRGTCNITIPQAWSLGREWTGGNVYPTVKHYQHGGPCSSVGSRTGEQQWKGTQMSSSTLGLFASPWSPYGTKRQPPDITHDNSPMSGAQIHSGHPANFRLP